MENLILGILSEFSIYDSRLRIDRSRTGKISKVQDNYYRGGDPAFGLRIHKEQKGSRLVIDEFESKYVILVYEMYHGGYSIKDIKRKLESDGVKTRRGNSHWSLGTIQLMLRNDTYIGIDEFHDKKSGITIRNQIPAIIPMKLFEEVQERRTRTLMRKGQMNRTVKEYLFRDFLFCSCGTPIGGRIKPSKSVQQYYCPLSERKFNKSISDNKVCTMKRCVQIDKTEELLWNSLYNLIGDINTMKEVLTSSLKNNTSLFSKVRKQRMKVSNLLNNKQLELNKITDGIVEIERKGILGEFTSEEVYISLKSKLDSDYRRVHVEIEDLKNTLNYYTRQDSWYDSLGIISNLFSTTTDWTLKKKRSLLNIILDRVILNHDPNTLLHTLEMNLRIPLLLSEIKKGELLSAPFNLSSKPLKNKGDLTQSRSLYSTVVNCSPKVPNHSDDSNQKGYFLTMVLVITSPNLWMSPYSEYQQTLFGIIQHKHEVEGLNFVQISDWLNENHYQTPRGKVFTQSLAWSMYTKKMRSIKRFSRDNDTQVVSTGIDIINYVVDN
jgi:hypothetical protein